MIISQKVRTYLLVLAVAIPLLGCVYAFGIKPEMNKMYQQGFSDGTANVWQTLSNQYSSLGGIYIPVQNENGTMQTVIFVPQTIE